MTTTLHTHQAVGLTGTTYTVRTDDGRAIGTYHQDHGADAVTCDQLPSDLQNIAGPIEAIAAITSAAAIREFKLSEDENKTVGPDLLAEVQRRVEGLGGQSRVYISHLAAWAFEIGICPTDIVRALMGEPSRELVA